MKFGILAVVCLSIFTGEDSAKKHAPQIHDQLGEKILKEAQPGAKQSCTKQSKSRAFVLCPYELSGSEGPETDKMKRLLACYLGAAIAFEVIIAIFFAFARVMSAALYAASVIMVHIADALSAVLAFILSLGICIAIILLLTEHFKNLV